MLMLRDKIQEQQKFIDSHANCKTKVEQLEQELEKTKQTALMSTQQAETYKSQMKALDKEIKDLEEKCKSSNDELGKLKGLLKSAAQALKSALKSESTNNLIHNDEIISTILDILLTAPKNTSSELQQTSYKPGDLGFVPPTKLPPLKSSK
jgi:chromosome segregation ATPase